MADMLIRRCLLHRGTRWLCVREIQKSLMQSAKVLIEAELARFKLGESDGFRALVDRITTPGGGLIVFAGMQDHTAESIKSYEGFDGVWVEEAQSLSRRSLDLLRPTIRKEGSELWFTWNPRRKSDPVDALLRGDEPPTDSVVVRANWDDNPWFPAVLEVERRDCLRINPDQYAHIWEGDYVTVAAGSYFAQALAQARLDGRIGECGADPLLQYRVFADIGGSGARADAFAFWVAQFVGQSIRVLDYYEAQGQDVGTHLAWLRQRGYTPGKASIWLPHDGDTQDRVYDASYAGAFKTAGYAVEVVPNQGKGAATARIEAVRRRMPICRFNEQACSGGLAALGWYHERRDDDRGIGLGPNHDWSSHGCDSFGLLCTVYQEPEAPSERMQRTSDQYEGNRGGY